MTEVIAVSNTICAIVCAKWALDLGFSQVRQILFLFGGLILGPLMMLVLYIFLVSKGQKNS